MADVPNIKPDPGWSFSNGEEIDLREEMSDFEDETAAAGLGSPFHPKNLTDPTETAAASSGVGESDCAEMGHIDLGSSILGRSKPAASTGPSNREKMLAAQRAFAEKLLAKNAAQKVAGKTASMPEDDDQAGDDKPRGSRSNKDSAAQRFEKAKAAYQRKKRAKTTTIQDDVEFMKIEHAEQQRLAKIQADYEYDRTPTPDPEGDEEGMFVSETEAPVPKFSAIMSDDDDDPDEPARKKRGRKRTSPDDDDDDDSERPKRGKPKKSQKAARKVPGTNYADGDVTDILERARRQKAMKVSKRSKKTAPAKRGTGPAMTNLASVMGTDVFNDAAAVSGLADQPAFGPHVPGRRPDALKQLIASVPVEDQKVAASDKRYLDEAIKAFTGVGSVKPHTDGNWTVKGMRTTLKHYQIMGTAFLRRRENDTHEPRGGILADQMGLGKTLMMLANIVNGKPKEKAKIRATLIVASPALVTQWAAEIERHTIPKRENKQHGLGTVIQYRAGYRLNSNNSMELLEQADVVLTTYTEVQKSYPKAIPPASLVTSKQKDDWWRETYEEKRGILHRIRWLRVVLDEAQAIKNHRSHTSMACRALDSKHNWAITGTPVLNNVKEFYPYFKFLREPHTGTYKIFKQNFCSPDDPDGVEKLGVFLRRLMIRRTHIDLLFGARLLDLPTPKEHTLWLEFNDVERQIYEIVKKRFISRINCISKQQGQAGLEKQYSHIFSMILRLRQICGHILLVQGTILDLLEREDFEKLNRITENEDAQQDEGGSLLLHLRNVLANNTGVKSIEGGISGAVLSEDSAIPMGVIDGEGSLDKIGGKHGLSFRFGKYLQSLKDSDAWDRMGERMLCCGCRQPPQDPHVTSCFHIYCFVCLSDLQHLAARRGHDHARCSECGEAYTSSAPCVDMETYQRRESTESSEATAQPKQSKAGKKDKNGGMEDWIGMNGEVLPSAKTQALKVQVILWKEEDPKAKIIIYTQFLPMVRIISKVCQTEKWGYVTYTGNMSHESRDKAIAEFTNDPNKTIMIASLKCGGLGLNLTMASRVCLLDPWWNSAVEQQAFCRVFRIGQQKETRMTRLVVKNTIDAAMMAMKERKQIEIDEVMDKQKDRLSVNDLMRLFGEVGEDESGHAFIWCEDAGPETGRLANIDDEDEAQIMGNEE